MEATRKQYYKYCIVPMCPSTTFKTPDKLFIRVPNNKSRRLKWLKACRINNDISEKTGAHVCEDHFNLQEDMDNYVKFRLMGGLKKMKANVVPHIFDCHPDRKRSFTNHPRAAAVKRARKRIVDEAIASYSSMTQNQVLSQDEENACSSKNSTISIHPTEIKFENSGTVSLLGIEDSKRHVSTQTCPRFRSKTVQCELHCGVSVRLSPIKVEPIEVKISESTLTTDITVGLSSIKDEPIEVEISESTLTTDVTVGLSSIKDEPIEVEISESTLTTDVTVGLSSIKDEPIEVEISESTLNTDVTVGLSSIKVEPIKVEMVTSTSF